MNADNLRTQFMQEGLLRAALDANPYKQFEEWFTTAIESGIPEPSAVCLATVAEDGQPWQRMVLLKVFDEQGFVFFTNYGSRKAMEIEHRSKVAVHFHWPELERQVKIAGMAARLEEKESDLYFRSRPRESQIAAWASPQSKAVPNREYLENW